MLRLTYNYIICPTNTTNKTIKYDNVKQKQYCGTCDLLTNHTAMINTVKEKCTAK